MQRGSSCTYQFLPLTNKQQIEVETNMNIVTKIPDSLVESTVKSIMENYPEASGGSCMKCISWKYDAWWFTFIDDETELEYKLDKAKLLAAFPLIFTDKWPKGCTQPPPVWTEESADDWLCQCDAIDFDAFVQLACLGEVIYG